jgi:very-short-patch-repair endonuclease
MDPQSRGHQADLLISRIGARQHGVVAWGQLVAAGVTPTMIRFRVRSGRLHVVHRGVYSLTPVITERGRQQAALLACGPGAVLSHRSAGDIWRLLEYPGAARPWVTVAPSRSAGRPGIEIVRARVGAADIRTREGLRVTSPPRTVLDLSRHLNQEELENLVAESCYRGLASERELRDQIERYPRRPGNRAVRQVLALDGGPQRTRSAAERALLRLLREDGMRGFEVNAKVQGREVDFLWRAQSFAVEVDGWDGHKSRVAFERDRAKWSFLRSAGLDVMPVGAQRLKREPIAILKEIRSALSARG